MSEDQSAWDASYRKDFEMSRAAFEARSDFVAVVAEARQRGFRRISMLEQMKTGSADAYSWRGGVWVKE